jgi:hypothetical protein
MSVSLPHVVQYKSSVTYVHILQHDASYFWFIFHLIKYFRHEVDYV